MSRKYRQTGYMDGDRKDEAPRPRRRPSSEGPRSPRMTAFRKTLRCAMCGAVLPASLGEIQVSTQCPQCGADLHSCKTCVNFDPGSRFECTEPIPKRISPKDERNNCEHFAVRTTVEKTVTSGPKRPVDPREAFERLFKK
ncbi:MAG: hypothetical protein ACE5JX_20185 [Acidobacteriota bacterium]